MTELHKLEVGDWFKMYRIGNSLEGLGKVEVVGTEKNPVYKIRVYDGDCATDRFIYFRASTTKAGIENNAFVHVEKNTVTGRWNADKDCYGSKAQRKNESS